MRTPRVQRPVQADPAELDAFGDVVKRLVRDLTRSDSGPQRVLTTEGDGSPELGAFAEAEELKERYLSAQTDFAGGLHALERLLTGLYADCGRIADELRTAGAAGPAPLQPVGNPAPRPDHATSPPDQPAPRPAVGEEAA